jgi:hypothetical protein
MIVKRPAAVVVLHEIVRPAGVVVAGAIVVRQAHVALRAAGGRRALHCDGHRTPNGEQHGKNHQQPDAKKLHERKVSRRTG